MINNPNRSYQVACCILSSARKLFEQHDVPWFARAGVTAKGGDWECATCSGVFVWRDDSNPTFAIDQTCNNEREYTFIIETGRCVNESLENPCDPDWYGGCGELGADGCPVFDPAPAIEEPCGDKMTRPHEEAAFLWRDRDVLEACLADEVACCVQQCVGLRCKSVVMGSVQQATEGGCHFVTYSLTVTY